ncbi:MAG: YncE family protein [Planctomycetota bacterium]|nr:YncE family protein [Planctomycetota bacterium]
MNRRVWIGLAAVLSGMWALRVQGDTEKTPAPAGPLQIVKTIEGGGDGQWDYVTVDPVGRRIYVARATRVMVFDADTGVLAGEVPGLKGAHGVALVPGGAIAFATSGLDNLVLAFDTKTLAVLHQIKAGQKPDAVCYDPASKKIFAFNGRSGEATVIDPAAPQSAPGTVAIGGKLEAGVSDEAGRVYVNVEDKAEVAVIDTKTMTVSARWPLAPGALPTGIALDAARGRLYVGCSNEKLVVLDVKSGKVLADLPIGPRVDGVAYDPTLQAALSTSGGDGTIAVVRETRPGTFAVTQTIKTVAGARTIGLDAKTHRFYVPANLPPKVEGNKPVFGIYVVGVPGPIGTGN